MTPNERVKFLLEHRNCKFEYCWVGCNKWVEITFDEVILHALIYKLNIDGFNFREIQEIKQPYEKEYWHSSF